jgi:hypothetical protein
MSRTAMLEINLVEYSHYTIKIGNTGTGKVMYSCNPNTWEVVAGGV